MFHLIRLAFLYLVFGVGILFVQLNNTPCSAPAVLDDGGPPIGPPIDLARLGSDRDFALRLGKDVVFWLPRLIDLVGIRGMPFPDYLFGTQCKGDVGKGEVGKGEAGRRGPENGAAGRPAPAPATAPAEPLPPPRPRG